MCANYRAYKLGKGRASYCVFEVHAHQIGTERLVPVVEAHPFDDLLLPTAAQVSPSPASLQQEDSSAASMHSTEYKAHELSRPVL